MGFFDGFGISDLLTSATSLFGGFLSSKGIRDTNRTNLEIARETNKANRDNQVYQNEFNLNMWNKQNEYNSPLAQRQRLEAAGLNPIFNGLDGTGNAGGLQSAPFTAVNGAPMLNEAAPMGESIANLGKTLAEIQLMRSQANKNDADRALTEVETQTKQLLQKGELEIQGITITGLRKDNDIKDEQVKVLQKQKEKLVSEASEIDDRISSRRRELDIKDMTAKADKWYKEEVVKLEKQQLSQKDKELELADRRLAFDIAIGWARKFQEDKRIDISQQLADNDTERTNWQASKSYSDIQSQDTLLPYLANELQERVKNYETERVVKIINTCVNVINSITSVGSSKVSAMTGQGK